MRIARVNVYLPDDLAEEARRAGLNVSGLTQDAIRAALRSARLDRWLADLGTHPSTGVSPDAVLAAVAEAKDDLGA